MNSLEFAAHLAAAPATLELTVHTQPVWDYDGTPIAHLPVGARFTARLCRPSSEESNELVYIIDTKMGGEMRNHYLPQEFLDEVFTVEGRA